MKNKVKKNPKKQPKYRNERDHTNFLTNLSTFINNRDDFTEGILVYNKKTL